MYLLAGECLYTLGDAADWDEVMAVVHGYLDAGGYDPLLYLDLTASVEKEDHFHCELTADA